jgi:transglutaminase-like putative cysteine protease
VHFEIQHSTAYHYSAPVSLGPHTVRLTPRCNGYQRLLHHRLDVSPKPVLHASALDIEGNVITRLWFAGETSELQIVSEFALDTLQDNPFDYVVDTPATQLPMPYSEREAPLLATYRYPDRPAQQVVRLASGLSARTGRNTMGFLAALNDTLHNDFEREIREHGEPQTPQVTLARGRGACRDLAALFMAVCRAQGIAARFVSGYQARAETHRDRRYLHAWPEVYIPGGGWRGFDPSHGTAVAGAHVAVAAACSPVGAAPVEGTFFGDGVSCEMTFDLKIHTNP